MAHLVTFFFKAHLTHEVLTEFEAGSVIGPVCNTSFHIGFDRPFDPPSRYIARFKLGGGGEQKGLDASRDQCMQITLKLSMHITCTLKA